MRLWLMDLILNCSHVDITQAEHYARLTKTVGGSEQIEQAIALSIVSRISRVLSETTTTALHADKTWPSRVKRLEPLL